MSYKSALDALQEECKRLSMTGRIGWHSFKKGVFSLSVLCVCVCSLLAECVCVSAYGMAVWLMSGKDPVVTAKLLNHQDTKSMMCYLRIEDEKLTKIFKDAQGFLGFAPGSEEERKILETKIAQEQEKPRFRNKDCLETKGFDGKAFESKVSSSLALSLCSLCSLCVCVCVFSSARIARRACVRSLPSRSRSS